MKFDYPNLVDAHVDLDHSAVPVLLKRIQELEQTLSHTRDELEKLRQAYEAASTPAKVKEEEEGRGMTFCCGGCVEGCEGCEGCSDSDSDGSETGSMDRDQGELVAQGEYRMDGPDDGMVYRVTIGKAILKQYKVMSVSPAVPMIVLQHK